jgi:hypothetical protein
VCTDNAVTLTKSDHYVKVVDEHTLVKFNKDDNTLTRCIMGADMTVPGWLTCGKAFDLSKLDRPAKIRSIEYYSSAYLLSLTDQTSMVDIGYLTALESPDMSDLV